MDIPAYLRILSYVTVKQQGGAFLVDQEVMGGGIGNG